MRVGFDEPGKLWLCRDLLPLCSKFTVRVKYFFPAETAHILISANGFASFTCVPSRLFQQASCSL